VDLGGGEEFSEMAARRKPDFRAVLVSLVAVFVVLGLVLFQPDLGGAVVPSRRLVAGSQVRPAASLVPIGSAGGFRGLFPGFSGVAPLEEASFGLANPPENVLPIAPHPCGGGLSSACISGWLESIDHARSRASRR